MDFCFFCVLFVGSRLIKLREVYWRCKSSRNGREYSWAEWWKRMRYVLRNWKQKEPHKSFPKRTTLISCTVRNGWILKMHEYIRCHFFAPNRCWLLIEPTVPMFIWIFLDNQKWRKKINFIYFRGRWFGWNLKLFRLGKNFNVWLNLCNGSSLNSSIRAAIRKSHRQMIWHISEVFRNENKVVKR